MQIPSHEDTHIRCENRIRSDFSTNTEQQRTIYQIKTPENRLFEQLRKNGGFFLSKYFQGVLTYFFEQRNI